MNKPLVASLMVADVILFLGYVVWAATTKQNEAVVGWVGRIAVFVAVLVLARAWEFDWEIAVLFALALSGLSQPADLRARLAKMVIGARTAQTDHLKEESDKL